MKIKMSRLRKIIRDTINEISTPGDSRYDAYAPGTAKGGHSGVGSSYRKPSFKGFSDDDDTPTGYIDLEGNVHASREEMDEANHDIRKEKEEKAKADAARSEAEKQAEIAAKDGGNRNPSDFFLIIDSAVTRGRKGVVKDINGREFELQDNDPKLGADLRKNFLYNYHPERSSWTVKKFTQDIIKILADYGVMTILEDSINDKVIKKLGVRTPSNGMIFGIEDYLIAYKNRFITELKKSKKNML